MDKKLITLLLNAQTPMGLCKYVIVLIKVKPFHLLQYRFIEGNIVAPDKLASIWIYFFKL